MSFEEALELAAKGDSAKVDKLVGDIYGVEVRALPQRARGGGGGGRRSGWAERGQSGSLATSPRWHARAGSLPLPRRVAAGLKGAWHAAQPHGRVFRQARGSVYPIWASETIGCARACVVLAVSRRGRGVGLAGHGLAGICRAGARPREPPRPLARLLLRRFRLGQPAGARRPLAKLESARHEGALLPTLWCALYLPTSLHISPYLPTSPHISP